MVDLPLLLVALKQHPVPLPVADAVLELDLALCAAGDGTEVSGCHHFFALAERGVEVDRFLSHHILRERGQNRF